MTRSIPFHKQTDPSKQVGQIVLCMCKDRFKHQCPGEWEQGCNLGANEKHVVVVDDYLIYDDEEMDPTK